MESRVLAEDLRINFSLHKGDFWSSWSAFPKYFDEDKGGKAKKGKKIVCKPRQQYFQPAVQKYIIMQTTSEREISMKSLSGSWL